MAGMNTDCLTAYGILSHARLAARKNKWCFKILWRKSNLCFYHRSGVRQALSPASWRVDTRAVYTDLNCTPMISSPFWNHLTSLEPLIPQQERADCSNDLQPSQSVKSLDYSWHPSIPQQRTAWISNGIVSILQYHNKEQHEQAMGYLEMKQDTLHQLPPHNTPPSSPSQQATAHWIAISRGVVWTPPFNAPVERRTKHQNITCNPHSTTKQCSRYGPRVCA